MPNKYDHTEMSNLQTKLNKGVHNALDFICSTFVNEQYDINIIDCPSAHWWMWTILRHMAFVD